MVCFEWQIYFYQRNNYHWYKFILSLFSKLLVTVERVKLSVSNFSNVEEPLIHFIFHFHLTHLHSILVIFCSATVSIMLILFLILCITIMKNMIQLIVLQHLSGQTHALKICFIVSSLNDFLTSHLH